MKIQQNQNGGVITFGTEDFFGLISGYGDGSTINYSKIGKGAERLVAVNPYLNSLGALQPGLLGTVLTDAYVQVLTTIINAVVERTGANVKYWLLEVGSATNDAQIHLISASSPAAPYTISTTAPFPYKIGDGTGAHAHADFLGEDIITFNIDGTEYIFYSYNDATDGDVGRVGIAPANDAAFTDNWFDNSTGGEALNKNAPHPMIVGDDQKLYIADLAVTGTLAKLWQVSDAGIIASFTTIVPRNYVIRSFTKTPTHLVIFANKIKASATASTERGEAIALFWDYAAPVASYFYRLNDNEVTCGFNWNGIIGCFTTGRIAEFANTGYRSKLQILEGGRFVPKFNFSEAAPIHGGWDIVNNMLCWNSNGVVYSYGSPYPDYPAVVNKIAQIVSGGATASGFLKALNGLEIYISTGSGTNNEVFKQATTFYATSAWRGIPAEPLFPPKTQGKVDYVEIGFFGSAASGRTITITLDFDYGNSTKTVLNAVGTITAGKQILYRSSDSSGGSFPPFSAIKPIVSWAAGSGSSATPKISFIKIYHSLKAITF